MGSQRARFLAIPLAACCVMFASVPVRAQTIYKCTDAQGDVAYQDRPCKGAAKQSVEYFAPPPARTDASDAAPPPFDALPPTPTAASPAPAPIFESAPPKPLPVPPPIWFCTRPEDGTRYVSHDGATPSRWVPAGILGMPGKSLAQTYGPGGGGGVAAPGVNKVPVTTAPRDSIAADLVEVHDECTPATLDQTCEHLRDELSTIEKKLPHAFNDERATLEPRRAELRRQLDGC